MLGLAVLLVLYCANGSVLVVTVLAVVRVLYCANSTDPISDQVPVLHGFGPHAHFCRFRISRYAETRFLAEGALSNISEFIEEMCKTAPARFGAG